MNHSLLWLACVPLMIPRAQGMEPAAPTGSQFYIARSNEIIDQLSISFKCDQARDLARTFRACKKQLVSCSENQALKQLRTYKPKLSLSSEKTPDKLKKMVKRLCGVDDPSCSVQVVLHNNLCKMLKKKIAHLNIDKTVVFDEELEDSVSMLTIALGQLTTVNELDVGTIAQYTLAYTIASLAARAPTGTQIPHNDDLRTNISALIDDLFNEPILARSSSTHKNPISHHFSYIAQGIKKMAPRPELEILSTITPNDLIASRDSRDQLVKLLNPMIDDYGSGGFLSKPFRLYEALIVCLKKIK